MEAAVLATASSRLAKSCWQAERVPCAVCGAPVLTPDAHRDFHPAAGALAERFLQHGENAGWVEP